MKRELIGCCGLWMALTVWFPMSAVAAAEPPAATPVPLQIDKPLVAYWDFDDQFGDACRDLGKHGYHASPESARAVDRAEGIFGEGLRLAGSHKLRVPEKPDFAGVKRISFSAWVMPAEMTEYNEIFRKEDDSQRVLFAFQMKGTILSLGLNVGGYVECDAPLDPAHVLDGQWHHCAATFDGRWMRVYLDGREIGALERPGEITAGGPAAGCIGSCNGGECFQGGMDELRIYADALTAEEVAALCRNGQDGLAKMSETVPADEPVVGNKLLAHWTFNERGATAVARCAPGERSLDAHAERNLPRSRGIHGNAIQLAGQHALAVDLRSWPGDIQQISFSAWVKPTDLSSFREIFRQESPARLLFSFQSNGSILSLGLNAGGYEECDAAIDPAQILDGGWHHCAGTFDGKWMRVYLDGREIGALERSGPLAFSPEPPAFVGSSGGQGEHFQGELDDLRVYASALSPAEIAQLYQAGVRALEQRSKVLQEQLAAFYAPGNAFAETLANCRRNLRDKGIRLDRELASATLARLKVAYPEDYEKFVNWVGVPPLEYVTARDAGFQVKAAGRLVELLVEYKPLTDAQWKTQTPEDLQKWKEAEQIQQRYEELVAQGDAALDLPAWIEIILAAGPRIQFRPRVSEAVAPYVTPNTPPTRDLTGEEARTALEQDWLHQADRNPSPERIKTEIEWTRQLAGRIAAAAPGRVDFSAALAKLAELEKQAAALAAADPQLYFQVREIKRTVALQNPVVDFQKMLLVDMPFPQGSEWPHETRHRLGYMAVPGGRLLVLDGLSPTGHLTQLMPQTPLHGSFWRPDVSWDGRKVVFCFKPHNEKSFHLYEINVDGTGLMQLTDGMFDDFDPVYLPDEEHILFSTTRGHTYVRCMPPTNAYVLARCDRDGKNVYLVSYNNEPDYLPSVMNDGRVVYTRWEYTDKPLWRAQKLWTMNPDGTQVATYWGNQSVWPDLMKDARAIPGSRRVMFTGSAHHNWFSGSVGIIDPDRGYNFPDGLTKITGDVPWPETGNGPVDPIESPRYHASGQYAAYYSPYPLGEQDFLVSANRGGKFVLYLMDVDGNRELIYEGTNNIFHAIPLKARQLPPRIADRVAWPSREKRRNPESGVIFSNNVYYGAPQELKDKAKYLRVWHIDPKTYTYWHKRPYISTGPEVSMVQSEGVKRLLGTVPIEADGSVSFRAPPNKALHFQLLDENLCALQTMRSFVGVMPGESRGCLGCHETHSKTPQHQGLGLATARPPRDITPPPWGEDTVSYPRYVQPVLDQYCGKCHQGDGEARKDLDLTRRPGFLIFDEPYVTLTGRPAWGQPYVKPANPPPGFGIANTLMVEGYDQRDPAAYRTPPPMTALSYKSRLVELCASGKHYDVKVDPVSLQRVIAWVDAMCPYRGDEEVRAISDPEFQGVDWLAIRPRIQSAPQIVRPGPVD